MKQPKISDLVIDHKGTKRMRADALKTKKIKINIDKDCHGILPALTWTTDAPYQKLLNQILKEELKKREQFESRLDRVEKELARLKMKLEA